MDDKQRLLQWMTTKGISKAALAVQTGDTPSSISQMTTGERAINDAFRWRFLRAFGHEEALAVFGQSQPAQVNEYA